MGLATATRLGGGLASVLQLGFQSLRQFKSLILLHSPLCVRDNKAASKENVGILVINSCACGWHARTRLRQPARPTSTGVTDDLGILGTGRSKKSKKPRWPSQLGVAELAWLFEALDILTTFRDTRERMRPHRAALPNDYFPRRRRITPPSPSRPDPKSRRLAGSGVVL